MPKFPWLTLIVPGIGPSLRQVEDVAQAQSLSRLAGRGMLELRWDRRDAWLPLRPWQRGLLSTLDISRAALASGPVSAVGCELVASDGYWLHAQPVHFAAGLQRVTFGLLEGEAQITAAEHLALTQSLAPHFPADGFTLHASSGEWFMRVANPLEVETSSPEAAATNDLQSMMPRGKDAAVLRRLMTEFQMLLHEHPVNERRASLGLPAVNALWLWGGGACPNFEERSLPVAFGVDSFLAGLYRLHNQPVQTAPAHAADLSITREMRQLIVVASVDGVQALESQWTGPLAQMLSAGKIGRLDVMLDEWHLQADRGALRRFWRRPLSPVLWERAS
jgi:hypothetical protein